MDIFMQIQDYMETMYAYALGGVILGGLNLVILVVILLKMEKLESQRNSND